MNLFVFGCLKLPPSEHPQKLTSGVADIVPVKNKMDPNTTVALCTVCQKPNYGQTVQCDGQCQKYYHVKCVGLTFRKAAQLPQWVCNNCNVQNESISFAHTHSSTLVAPTQVDRLPEGNNQQVQTYTGTIPKIQQKSHHEKTVNESNPFKCASVTSKKSNRSLSSTTTKSSVVNKKMSLLEQKAKLAREKREMLEIQMKLLDEEQSLIDEQLKTVDELENSMSEEAGSSNSSQKSLDEISQSGALGRFKSLTLEEKIHMYQKDMYTPPGFDPNFQTRHKAEQADKMKPEIIKTRKIPSHEPEVIDLAQWTARQTVPQTLSKFSGEKGQWASFINAYENSTKLCKLSDAENLGRLQLYLVEPARGFVNHLLNDPKNVERIIETLKMVYGNPKKLLKEMFDEIRRYDDINENDLPSIVKYGLAVQNMCTMIDSSGLESYASNPLILEELVDKLPKSLQFAWAQAVGDLENINLKDFEHWLSRLSRNLCRNLGTVDLASPTKKQKAWNKRKANIREDVHVVQKKEDEKLKKCFACSGHCGQLSHCETFELLNDDCKWQVIKRYGICRQCLTQHKMKPPFVCDIAVKCDIGDCNGNHHPLMHRNSKDAHISETSYEHVNFHAYVNNPTNFRYIPVRLIHNSKSIEVMAFLDCGSTGTFLEHVVAKELDLEGPTSALHLKFSGDSHHTENDSMNVSLEISGIHDDATTYKMKHVHTVKNLNLREQHLEYEQLAKRFSHLKNLPVASYSGERPSILIGLRHWKLALEREIRVNDENESPIASKCLLGWSIYAGGNDVSQSINFCDERECLFSLGVKVDANELTSYEDRRALKSMNKTAKNATIEEENEEEEMEVELVNNSPKNRSVKDSIENNVEEKSANDDVAEFILPDASPAELKAAESSLLNLSKKKRKSRDSQRSNSLSLNLNVSEESIKVKNVRSFSNNKLRNQKIGRKYNQELTDPSNPDKHQKISQALKRSEELLEKKRERKRAKKLAKLEKAKTEGLDVTTKSVKENDKSGNKDKDKTKDEKPRKKKTLLTAFEVKQSFMDTQNITKSNGKEKKKSKHSEKSKHEESVTDKENTSKNSSHKHESAAGDMENTVKEPSKKQKKKKSKVLEPVHDSNQSESSPPCPLAKKRMLSILNPKGSLNQQGFEIVPVTPEADRLKRNRGFIEEQATPKNIEFKVQSMMPSGEDFVKKVNKKRKRTKRDIPEPSRAPPKPVWTTAGVFEEIDAPETTDYISLSRAATQFGIAVLNKKHEKEGKNGNSHGLSSFKMKALYKDKAHLRETSKDSAQDGQVRSASVKLANGSILERPVVKLAKLEISGDQKLEDSNLLTVGEDVKKATDV